MREEEEWQDINDVVLTGMQRELRSVTLQISDLNSRLLSISKSLENKPDIKAETAERLADVEIRIKKLWEMITEETPRGRPKLNQFGKSMRERMRN